MNSITPSSPLLTLTVKPNGNTSSNDLLARFHPIMKAMGFGNFEMEENGLYQARKDAETMLGSPLFVFAEKEDDAVIINIDGHSIFGLKGVEEQLKTIKAEYENSIDCAAELHGPNYANAFIGNILYTALPIYASATIIVIAFHFLEMRNTDQFNVYLYATLAIIAAKTRFWVNQLRKHRPVLLSILFLLLIAPAILALVAGIILVLRQFA
jgi:hypothetical protein